MADEPARITIRNKYAQQWTEDLESNRTRQSQLALELEQLKADEGWLLDQLSQVAASDTISGTDAVAHSKPSTRTRKQPTSATSEPSAAKPKLDTAAKNESPRAASKSTGTRKKTIAKSATTKSAGTASAKEPAPAAIPSAAGKASGKSAPPLHELMLSLLLKTPGEPRTTAELHAQLVDEQPQRATSVQTVRNSLERLVATSRISRSRQGSSVMYTADITPASSTSPQGDDHKEQASKEAKDDTAEKTPVEA